MRRAQNVPSPSTMKNTHTRSALGRAWLEARVHWDGFWSNPCQYIRALWWLLLRKRVRGLSLIEPLIGGSPRAYELWQQRNPIPLPTQQSTQAAGVDTPTIIVGLDLLKGQEGLDSTLASIHQQSTGVHIVHFCREKEPALPQACLPFWICLISPGDELAPDALQAYREAATAASERITIIYADDDFLDDQAKRVQPHFKPNWNPEFHRWHDAVSHACIIRIDDAEELSMLNGQPNWIQRLIESRLSADRQCVSHISRVLHHRRSRPEPRIPQFHSEALPPPETTPISVIIPTRNKIDLLRTCLDGLRKTDYTPLEIIVIDNDSDEPDACAYLDEINGSGCTIIRYPGPFNYSAMNNAAVANVSGELICFLNNDIEILDKDWLTHLARQALRPDVGAAGARLLYPDGSIQHAGVVTGVGGGAAHAHRFLSPREFGYFSRHNLPQFVSAVTAACLVVSREKFLAVGGFDAQHFPVAFNDVDLCLKLNRAGWQSFYEPRATLIHHESKSRGKDSHPANRERFARELEALKAHWQTETIVDPYHNPNLSRYSEHFVLRL